MTVYFPFVYENILTANNNELSRLALMLIKVNGGVVYRCRDSKIPRVR
jgi:hypothetical protein